MSQKFPHRISLDLDADQYRKLKKYSFERNTASTEVVRKAVAAYIEGSPKDPASSFRAGFLSVLESALQQAVQEGAMVIEAELIKSDGVALFSKEQEITISDVIIYLAGAFVNAQKKALALPPESAPLPTPAPDSVENPIPNDPHLLNALARKVDELESLISSELKPSTENDAPVLTNFWETA